MTPAERFWLRVAEVGTCWLWLGAKNGNGYGRMRIAGKNQYPHRMAYEWFVGPIPDGLQIDHLCRNRLCVNPAHLEAVTQRENMRRGMGPAALQARWTECIRGHPFSPENTYTNPKGARHCRVCMKAGQRRRREAIS